MDKNQLFRKESLDRISSPEQLTDYLRVTNPSTWIVFAAVIIMLLGVLAWSVTGSLETTVDIIAVSSGGKLEMIVPADKAGEIGNGQTVRIGEAEAVTADVTKDEYGRTVVYAYSSLEDGEYNAQIVTEKITPISFLIN